MSNHYHVVLFIDQAAQKKADAQEIVSRWHQLHQGNPISVKFLDGELLEPHETDALNLLIDVWRERLASISWYMRVINEKIARMANIEDNVTGRFWEGRFKCQALLDSIQKRVRHWQDTANTAKPADKNALVKQSHQPDSLHPFVGNLRQDMPKGIVFNLVDYLQLVDWTGRQIRHDKSGAIPSNAVPVLERLSISPKHWVYLCSHFESHFKGLVGSAHSLKQACKAFNRQRTPNLSSSVGVFT